MNADATSEERFGSPLAVLDAKDSPQLASNMYECRVVICPESEGGFSAHALRLPGVVSQGETIEESLANIADAFRAAMGVYSERDLTIPWQDVDVERTEGAMVRWILVDA